MNKKEQVENINSILKITKSNLEKLIEIVNKSKENPKSILNSEESTSDLELISYIKNIKLFSDEFENIIDIYPDDFIEGRISLAKETNNKIIKITSKIISVSSDYFRKSNSDDINREFTTEITSTIEILRGLLESSINNIEKIEQTKDYLKNKNARKKMFDEESDYEEIFDEKSLEINKKTESFNNFINAKKEELEKELAEIQEKISEGSETSLSKDFSEQSFEDHKSANKYRNMAITILVACGIGNAILFILGLLDEISNTNIATRFIAISMFLIPAFYMIRESSKHREQENKNKRISLTLKSLNSYLSDTNEETKQLVKSTLAREMFSEKESASSNHIETVNLIKEMKDLFK